MAIVGFVLFAQGFAGASGWEPRENCGHLVAPGETLYQLERWYGVPMEDIAAQTPNVDPDNLDYIEAGWTLDVCEPDLQRSFDQPAVDPSIVEWMTAVRDAAPPGATANDIHFLGAVAKYESAWGTNIWNLGDQGLSLIHI